MIYHRAQATFSRKKRALFRHALFPGSECFTILSIVMVSFAFRRPHLVAEGAEEIKGKDIWLDNDDLRPLKLKDRTWTATTYFVFWFSATATVSNWCV